MDDHDDQGWESGEEAGEQPARDRPLREAVGPVVLLAVLGSIGAGMIQVTLGESMPERPGARGLAMGIGTAQVLVGVGLLVFTSHRAAMWAVVVNCFAIAVFAVTSVVGISILEGLEVVTEPTLVQWSAAVLASIAGFAGVLVARPDRGYMLVRGPHSYAPGIAATAMAMVIVVLAMSRIEREPELILVGSGDDLPTRTSTTDIPVTTRPTTTSPAPTTEAVVVPTTGMTTTTDDTASSTTVPDGNGGWRLGATDQQVTETEELIAATRMALRAFPTVDDARDAGYVLMTDKHMVHAGYLDDGLVLDPAAIEALLVEGMDGDSAIVGATYLLRRRTTIRDVPDTGGPLLTWHAHAGTQPMLHIWLDPLIDSYGNQRTAADCGVFVYLDLPEDRDIPGCTSWPRFGLGHDVMKP